MTKKKRPVLSQPIEGPYPSTDAVYFAARELARNWLNHWAVPSNREFTDEKYVSARMEVVRLFYPDYVTTHLAALASEIRSRRYIAGKHDLYFPEGAD